MICKYCGKEIEENINGFCDNICQGKYYGEQSLLVDYGTVMCKVCGKEFKKKSTNQELCSDECRKQFYYTKYNKKRYCKKCGSELEKGQQLCAKCKEEQNKRVCERCGKEFFIKDYSSKKYCSYECSLKPQHTKICGYCGKEFTTTREEQKYCTQKCSNLNTQKSHLDFMKELIEMHNGTIVPTEMYKGSDYELECVCLRCGSKMKKLARFYIGSFKYGCSKCNIKSHGENKVLQYIKDKEYEYARQYTIKEVKYKNTLLFDFAILKDNNVIALIEYDGEQHFKPIKRFGGDKQYKKQIEKDEIKNNYCKENNIPLIRIPYTEESVEQYLDKVLNKLIS